MVIDANFSLIEVGGRRIIQGMFRDVSERERNARELEALSLTDALTGLRNRRGFTMLAEQQLKTARRLSRPLLLLFADVDGLKEVNDTHGHAAGDQLLREAARVLAGSSRDMDIVARMGGDEFAVLQIDAGSGEAPAVVERLAVAIAAANAAPGRAYGCPCPSAPRPSTPRYRAPSMSSCGSPTRACTRSSGRARRRGRGRRRAGGRGAGGPRRAYSLKAKPAAKTRVAGGHTTSAPQSRPAPSRPCGADAPPPRAPRAAPVTVALSPAPSDGCAGSAAHLITGRTAHETQAGPAQGKP